MLSPEVLAKLAQFDTPTICNLIELFDIRPRDTGYMDRHIAACFPEMPPMVGYAATATFRASLAPRKGDGYGSLMEQVERFGELEGPPIVVFQDLDQPSVGATFGEIMCATYQAFGAQGLITSGTGRDLDQVQRTGFPVFTAGTACSHGYFHIPQIHVPVHVGGLAVYPGDLLHGDRNGITSIPTEIAAELSDIGDEFLAAETLVLETLREPEITLARLKEVRAEAAAIVDGLRRRVSTTRKSI